MAGIRNDNQIIKGSMLMVFIGGSPVGFATSHSLSLTMNTTEVSTKDHGDYPSVTPQSVGWEITAENLYSDDGESIYMDAMINKTLVTIAFAKSDYSATDEKGVIGPNGHSDWSISSTIASGKAYITSFSVNAPAGDNATMSVTFTGVGALEQAPSSQHAPAQGNQGPQG